MIKDYSITGKKSTKDIGNVSIIDAYPVTRAIAFLIDFLFYKLIVILILLVFLRFSIITPDGFSELAFIRTNIYEYPEIFRSLKDLWIHISFSLLFLLYFSVLESDRVWGTSPGKRLLKLQVVDEKGYRLSFKDSFLRNSTKYILRLPIIGIIFGFIEIILIVFYSRRSGDLIVNSRVASGMHKGRVHE